jgi:hypothetical protein
MNWLGVTSAVEQQQKQPADQPEPQATRKSSHFLNTCLPTK